VNDFNERKGGCCSSNVFRVKVLALVVWTCSESSIYSQLNHMSQMLLGRELTLTGLGQLVVLFTTKE
jgi:hypothetical protein